MAYPVRTYTLLRAIHFYSAAAGMIFLILLFATGYLLEKPAWFDGRSEEPRHQSLDLVAPVMPSEKLAVWIKERLDLDAKTANVRTDKDGIFYATFITPGSTYNVVLDPRGKSSAYTITPNKTFGKMTVMHRMHRYTGEFKYDAYVAMTDVASLSLIVFCCTGIPLWISLQRKKTLGIFFLSLGAAYTLFVIISFYW